MKSSSFLKVAVAADKCDADRNTMLPVHRDYVCISENRRMDWLGVIGMVADQEDGVGIIDIKGVDAILALREACDRILNNQHRSQ